MHPSDNLAPIASERTPIVIKLAKGLDPNDAKYAISISYPAFDSPNALLHGIIHIFKNPTGDTGHILPTSDENLGIATMYKLNDLGYNPVTGKIILYAEGTYPTKNKSMMDVDSTSRINGVIKARLLYKQNTAFELASIDTVKYLVTNEKTFYDVLQGNRDVRTSLLSRSAYGPSTEPNYSQKRLTKIELYKKGFDKNLIDMLYNETASNAISGFKVGFYQDFTQGPDTYIVAFGASDVPVPKVVIPSVWTTAIVSREIWLLENTAMLLDWYRLYVSDDFADNINQALGKFSPQYQRAMLIASKIDQQIFAKAIVRENIFFTGQSLGGGLAAAAAVVANIPAETYNSAGLHVNTLLDSQLQERYPGSIARFVTLQLVEPGMGGRVPVSSMVFKALRVSASASRPRFFSVR